MVEVVIEVEVEVVVKMVVVMEVDIGVKVEVEMEIGTRRRWDSEAVLFCWDELVCRCVRFAVVVIGTSLLDWLLLA